MSIIWGGLQVALLCAAALGYGSLALPREQAGKTALEQRITRMAIGLGLLIMATMAAGWLRLWGAWFHHGVLGVGIILLAMRPQRPALQAQGRLPWKHLFWAAPTLAGLLFYAAFPPTFYDALLYHLGVPAYYLQAGGFAPWPENVFSALPQNAEMLNLLLLSGGSVHGPKWLSLAVTLALLLYLFDWGRESRLHQPWLPVLIFFAIPEVVFLSATEKNDMLLMLFLLLGVRQLGRLNGEGGGWRTCGLAGVFLGLAGGVKWQGLFYGAAFMAAHVLTARASWPKRLARAALLGLIIVLLISPWLAKNQAEFGNPVHPYLGGFFSDSGEAREQARQIQEGVRRGQGFTPGAILSFCQRMFLQPYSLGLTHVTGVLLLLLLPCLFFAGCLPGRGFLLAGCATAFTLLLAFARVPRYFLPVFMLLALPLAAGWQTLLERLPRFRRLAFALLFTLVLFQAVQAVSLLESMTLGGRFVWRKLKGSIPTGARYLDVIPYYPAVAYGNRVLPLQACIAFIGEERTFYIQRPFRCASQYDANPVLIDFLAAADAAAWAETMRQRGITHVLYSLRGLERMDRNAGRWKLDAAQKRRLDRTLGGWPRLFTDGRYSLVQVGR